jgi:transcription initiation factor TFIIIB Brf1 subunit/transcription initiation factor TFIIB
MNRKEQLIILIEDFKGYVLSILDNREKDLKIWINNINTKNHNSLSTFIGWMNKDILPIIQNKVQCINLLIKQSEIKDINNFTNQNIDEIYNYLIKICDFFK